jgi:hypothetical protein
MTYRALEPKEWGKIEAEFSRRGLSLPYPENAFIVGAFLNEEIVGFLVCQKVMHMEPLVAYDPRVIRGLVKEAERILGLLFPGTTYYAFAKEKVAKIAELFGFVEMPYKVFSKGAKCHS